MSGGSGPGVSLPHPAPSRNQGAGPLDPRPTTVEAL
ncbi:MAG: hypothetical protein QOF44_2096, partial [Streptomyces sp.]|nr:hypothetical protein [Streptomyces sp.]